MKVKYIYTASILLIATLVFTACSKKDRSPTLIVHVQDSGGTSIVGSSVHAWPTDQLKVDTLSSGVPNLGMDQTLITDDNGDATFEFEFSSVLDIDVTYTQATSDTTSVALTGHKVVKIETIKQKDEENIFEETITIE